MSATNQNVVQSVLSESSNRQENHMTDQTPTTPARLPAELAAALAAPIPASDLGIKSIYGKPRGFREMSAEQKRNYRCDMCGTSHEHPNWDKAHLDYLGHAIVTERLNDVLGPDGWRYEYQTEHSGSGTAVRLHLHVRLPDGTWFSKGPEIADDDDGGIKGEQSAFAGALVRAAMRWGVGTRLWHKPRDGRKDRQDRAEAANASRPREERRERAARPRPDRPAATLAAAPAPEDKKAQEVTVTHESTGETRTCPVLDLDGLQGRYGPHLGTKNAWHLAGHVVKHYAHLIPEKGRAAAAANPRILVHESKRHRTVAETMTRIVLQATLDQDAAVTAEQTG